MNTRIQESDDDVDVPEFVPPQLATRDFSSQFESFANTGIRLDELPDPELWRCLIFPKQPIKQTESGILLASETTNNEAILQYIGQVIKLGPLAGKNDNYKNPWYDEKSHADFQQKRFLWNVGVGDWVIFGKFAGLQFTYMEQNFKILNDDEIVARIDHPDGYKVWI